MNYKQEISNTPVTLVEFYATWCPHCRNMMPVVDRVKEALSGKASVIQIDVDKNEDIADNEKVEVYPTFILYKSGREVWRDTGETDSETLMSKVESYLMD